MDDWMKEMARKAMESQDEPASPSHPSPGSGQSQNEVAERLRNMTRAYQPQAQRALENQKEMLLEQQLRLEKLRAQEQQKRLDEYQTLLWERNRENNTLHTLLSNLVEGMKLRGVEAPGYDEALAYFVQEKMLCSPQPPVTGAGGGGVGGNASSAIGGAGGGGGAGGAGSAGFLAVHYSTHFVKKDDDK
jgi:hypothetical protein